MESIKISILFFAQLFSVSVFANVNLASSFGDYMVLQRDMKVPVWGTADAGEKVTLKHGYDSSKRRALLGGCI